MHTIVYGGYNDYPFYSRHLSDALGETFGVESSCLACTPSDNNITRIISHYFPPRNRICSTLCDLFLKRRVTHFINYNTNHFDSSSLLKFKKFGVKISAYYNDSPFSSYFKKRIYFKSSRDSLHLYDHLFFYRELDRNQFLLANPDRETTCHLLLPSTPLWSDVCFLTNLSSSVKSYDFGFVGHFEHDGRENLLLRLLELGYKCFVAGPGWGRFKKIKSKYPNLTLQSHVLDYRSYLQALSFSKVNIGFTSLINRDIYTRRYFEAPFAGGIFMAQYSVLYRHLASDLQNLFFFSNHLPSISECRSALLRYSADINSIHSFSSFFSKNNINTRVNILANFLYEG